jgi:hypothetical protein
MIKGLSALLMILSIGFSAVSASAFEMQGLIGYDAPMYTQKPIGYQSSGGGVSYSFYGRFDLGPGAIESGFIYVPTSLTWNLSGVGNVTANGSYWLIPILYRVPILPPFMNLAIGPDFAYMGNTTFSVQGTSLPSSGSGFKSHFGAEASLQALQDLGENLSAVLDLRYRQAIGYSLAIGNEEAHFNFFMISLGIQKRLE